jgi:hypothetical protein
MTGGGGKGGGSSSGTSISVSGTTEVDSDVEIHGLDNIKTDNTSRLVFSTPSPLESEFAITKPIKTDATGKLDTNSALSLDVKPLVTDTCVKLELGRLPPTRVRQPYETHFGFTFFGVEIFGFSACGESEVMIEDASRRSTRITRPPPRLRPASSAPAAAVVTTGRDGTVRVRMGG